MEQESRKTKKSSSSFIPGVDDMVIGPEVPLHEKRTRFSLSHDQDSIGMYCCLYVFVTNHSSMFTLQSTVCYLYLKYRPERKRIKTLLTMF